MLDVLKVESQLRRQEHVHLYRSTSCIGALSGRSRPIPYRFSPSRQDSRACRGDLLRSTVVTASSHLRATWLVTCVTKYYRVPKEKWSQHARYRLNSTTLLLHMHKSPWPSLRKSIIHESSQPLSDFPMGCSYPRDQTIPTRRSSSSPLGELKA